MSTKKNTTFSLNPRLQAIRSNKKNQQTANRIAQIGESDKLEHKHVLRLALQQWADAVKLPKRFPDITDLLTAEAVYRLIYCEPRSSTHERDIVVHVARAIAEGKTAEQCAKVFKSKTAYHKDIIARAAEWLETRDAARPIPPDDDGILDADILYTDDDILSEDIITGISKRPPKPTRRIRIDVKRFECYGIKRGSVATVVMNGEVRMGELGYFAWDYKDSYHGWTTSNRLAIVCEQDSTCIDYAHYNGRRKPGGVCLRTSDLSQCDAIHNATAYGRVSVIERDGQAVEHALTLRPFDGRL